MWRNLKSQWNRGRKWESRKCCMKLNAASRAVPIISKIRQSAGQARRPQWRLMRSVPSRFPACQQCNQHWISEKFTFLWKLIICWIFCCIVANKTVYNWNVANNETVYNWNENITLRRGSEKSWNAFLTDKLSHAPIFITEKFYNSFRFPQEIRNLRRVRIFSPIVRMYWTDCLDQVCSDRIFDLFLSFVDRRRRYDNSKDFFRRFLKIGSFLFVFFASNLL